MTRPKLLLNLEKLNTAASAGMGAPAVITDASAAPATAEVGVDPVPPPPVGTTDGMAPSASDGGNHPPGEGDAPSSDLPHPPARPQSRSNHRQALPPPPPRAGGSAGDGSAAAGANRSQMPPTTPGSVDTSSMGGLSMSLSLPGSPSETPGQGLGLGLGHGLREDVSVMVSVGREESHRQGQGLGPGLEGGGDDSRDEARSISNSTISSHGITPALPMMMMMPSLGGSLARTSRNNYDGSISSATLPSVGPTVASPCPHVVLHHVLPHIPSTHLDITHSVISTHFLTTHPFTYNPSPPSANLSN